MFQIYGHTTRFPDFRVIGPSEIRLESDMADSPDFFYSEIRGDRFTDFCVDTARFSGNRLQKVGRLEKIGQWDHCTRQSLFRVKFTFVQGLTTSGIFIGQMLLLSEKAHIRELIFCLRFFL